MFETISANLVWACEKTVSSMQIAGDCYCIPTHKRMLFLHRLTATLTYMYAADIVLRLLKQTDCTAPYHSPLPSTPANHTFLG